MVAGRGFHTKQQRCLPFRWQLEDKFVKSFPVHGTGDGESLLSLFSNTARIKLFFRYINPDKKPHDIYLL
jgi:hypothetical protein